MNDFWDHQFSQPGYRYGQQPNAFLAEQAHRLPAGSRVLVPGDGEGRNSVWLAGQGHRVTAIDQSRVGLDKAEALAAQRGVALRTRQADLALWAPEAGEWDAVVLTYVHLPPVLRATAHQRLWQGLRPGGWFLLEAFSPAQLGRPSGGPPDLAMLYSLAQLHEDLTPVGGAQAEQHVAWEGRVHLDEGPGHQGEAEVVRLLLRKAV
ncbi:class I SAM-dependent methyltransferase [Pseudothauera nasutitermitis]|uniref:Class I SAM-dependent methyltransferase n=1 Tax=Pseudothauera nasutitermitis TaxID=2565930 RepID=A0A4S4AYL8_9RHOO|nr:class I SAM-dependent methyltransferase [Pseudothauera nasutitermitis]THF64776.1 class I SAM-dependent methyltransferase [Pseudothauera nasutitermitis]